MKHLNAISQDEFGQSPLHFAAARQHGRGALVQLMSDVDLSPALRDELYRTARDVAIQAGLPDNVAEVDKWVLGIAGRGETERLAEMLLDGYDHILDVRESAEVGIVDVASKRGHNETVAFLESIMAFEVRLERVNGKDRAGWDGGTTRGTKFFQKYFVCRGGGGIKFPENSLLCRLQFPCR